MITVLLIISIAVLIVGIVMVCKRGFSDGLLIGGIFAIAFGVFGIIGFTTWGVVELEEIATANTITQKIEMYEEENAEIEAKMDELVKFYIEYEKDTYESLKAESSITLISYFPELKSDEIVKKQLDVYYQNTADIKALREKLIDISKAKWRVYFGH